MFQKVLEYTGEYRTTTYLSIVFLIFGVVLNIIPFWLVYQLISPLLQGETPGAEGVALKVFFIALCTVGHAIFYVHGLALSHKSAYHTLQNLRVSLQKKMELQPLGTIQEKGIGAVKKMFIDDIESIELLLAHALPEGIANLAVPFFVYIAMFFVDWKLALLSLCSLPLGILAMFIMYRSGMGKMDAYFGAAQKMNNTIVEYINGMEVVKIFNRDGASYRRFEQDIHSYRDFTLDWYRVCWPWMAVYNSFLPCVAFFTLPVGGYFVLQGLSSLPDFVLVLCMSFGIGAPLLRAVGFMSTLPQINYKIDSLESMMNQPPLCQTADIFCGKNHEISFENVGFAYEAEAVLHDVSFQAAPGTLTALVGESGSGKSTLAKLLVHFYDVKEGAVKIGGQDVREMSLEALNQEISYVSQEQYLFNLTLRENIRLGKLSATDAEVLAAAEKAQCNEFFERLEKGIDTLAGDGGKQLSGGERQRISLARAILKNAPIVVLDEATAFMDPENEEKMNEAIAEVIQGKTVIVIAHRLKSIMDADKICVLNEGKLDAVGTHKELLKTSQCYQKLWLASEESSNWQVSTQAENKKGVESV